MLKPCNKENMLKFVQALESGEYSQCKESLRSTVEDNHSYCCLGVATELAEKSGVKLPTDTWITYTTLPAHVQDWLGIDEDNPLLSQDTGEVISAITMNDNLNKSFPLIALAFRFTYLEGDN